MAKPVINVTPLIDVLLVLLIIFMVVRPMKPAALKAKIPQPPAADDIVTLNPNAIVVAVAMDNSLKINNEKTL